MSDISSTPAPAPVPDYNTPAKAKFDLAKYFKERDGSYSSFWPLLFVFVALIVLFVYDVSYLRYRKLALTEQLSQLTGNEKAGREQRAFVDGLHKDMAALAPTHPDVAAILNEYFPNKPADSSANAEPPSATPQK
jgi:hypothetical protein